MTNQKIATKAAEAAYQNAKLTREVAEIAVKEYEEGIYLQDRATIQGEIKLAESAFQKAKARLERTRRARQKLTETLGRTGTVDTGDILAELDIDDRLDASRARVLREKFSLEKAQNKLNVLENYTKGKTLKELQDRGREGSFQRAGQAADMAAREGQGGQARGPDQELQALRSRRWLDRPRGQPGGRLHGSRTPEALLGLRPQRPHDGQRQGARGDGRPGRAGAKGPHRGRRVPGAEFDGVVTKVAGLPDRLSDRVVR